MKHPSKKNRVDSILSIGFILVLLIAGCRPAPDPLTAGTEMYQQEWNELVYGLVTVERYNPPKVSRVYAYLNTGFYEAIAQHPSGRLKSMDGQLNGFSVVPRPVSAYDPIAAASTVSLEVLRILFYMTTPFTIHELEELYNNQIARRRASGIPQGWIDEGILYGRQLAGIMSSWMSSDGFAETRGLPFEPITGDPYWVPTADYGMSISLNPVLNLVYLYDSLRISEAQTVSAIWGSNRIHLTARPSVITNQQIAMEPYWGTLRTFVLESGSAIEPEPHAPFSTDPESRFYAEVMAVYDVVNNLIPEQYMIAHYWADNPGETGTPPGHWIKIMTQAARQNQLDVHATAGMYLYGSLALADAFINCWYIKYQDNLLRPKTYINRYIDEHWETVLVSPPFPEYPSGHSVASGAAGFVLDHYFGKTGIVDSTHVNRYGFSPREFQSFSEAAAEAAISRLYGGIHYPMAIDNGVAQGNDVARIILSKIKTQ